MSESKTHKNLKQKAATKSGTTEKRLPSGKRIDAVSQHRATEIERSGRSAALVKAAHRLKESGKPQKVLQVPQKDFSKAAEAMRKVGVAGTIKNISGTKRSYVGVVVIDSKKMAKGRN